MLMVEIKIVDRMEIPADGKFHPETGHFGNHVWISKDGKTVTVQCRKSHHGKEKAVFLVKINSEK